MNKSDLKEIKDIVDSALGTHLATVHEEITDLRRDMDEKFAVVDARFTAVERGMDRLPRHAGLCFQLFEQVEQMSRAQRPKISVS